MRNAIVKAVIGSSLVVAACATDPGNGDQAGGGGGGKEDDGGEACRVDPAKLEVEARAFALDKGVMKATDEVQFSGGSEFKIAVKRTTRDGDRCLAVLSACYFEAGERIDCNGSTRDVIVYEPAGEDIVFTLFEDAYEIPASLRVAIGDIVPSPNDPQMPLTDDFYYTELTGPSVVMALKSLRAVEPYSGFAADLDGNGKVAFDPTPGRTWKVVEPTYSLRRGLTAEIHDVYPGQLDGDFQGYYEGSAGHVAPWSSGIRRFHDGTDWKDAAPRCLFLGTCP